MNIKDLFSQAENGVLNYEQFIELAKEAKFVDLREGNYVDKQKYTDDLAARDTRISTLDETIKSRETDLANLRTQLETAGTDADKLESLNRNFTDLQKKYDSDTKAYEKQLKDQAYQFAVNSFANNQTFTSQAAKRDFVNSMLAKKLTMDGDTIIGATDFVNAYTAENADAFATVETTPEPTKPQPHFVEPTSPTTSANVKANPFDFNFVGVRKKDN